MPELPSHSRKQRGSPRGSRPSRRKPATGVRPLEHFNEAIVEGTDRFLRDMCGDDLDVHSKVVLERLTAGAVKFAKESREHHHEAVALAYALYVFDSNNGWAVANALREDLGLGDMKRRANYDPVRFYLERLISYGTDDVGSAHKRVDWCYARDARAVRYLMQAGVGPDELCAKAQEPEEGLNAWSRRQVDDSASDSSTKKKPSVTKPTGQSQAPLFQIMLGGEVLLSEHEALPPDFLAHVVHLVRNYIDQYKDTPPASEPTPRPKMAKLIRLSAKAARR